jgi:probable HAF family extracellular repeat protein
MKFRTFTRFVATALIALAIPMALTAQEDQNCKKEQQRYKLIDLGTFGGPASYFQNGFDGILSNRGTAAGGADTSTPDPHPSFCFNYDCFVSHAFQWQDGVLTNLGALPGVNSSQAFWISQNGLIVGISQNGDIDPLIPGFPEFRAVLWQKGGITDLGTLDGGYESFATAVNNGGQVVGFSTNTTPDPFCLFIPGLCTTQTRAFLWQNGVMQDLKTLGGSDAMAVLINEHGQIAGQSYTDSTPNPVTGLPTLDPFLWQDSAMLDLGTLGGAFGFPTALNNRGEIVGQSNLAGDLTFHPFLWTKSVGMQDLGTLGGDTGTTNWISDAGEVVGKADLPSSVPQKHDAFLWKKGVMTDLGTLPGDSCSNAYYVNSRGQVVGTSEDQELCSIFVGQHAFLWEHGGPMIDLNTLVPPGSGLQLTYAVAINDRGEIAGFGVPPGVPPENYETQGHAYILIPCDANHADTEGCGDADVGATTATQAIPAPVTPSPSGRTQANPALSDEPAGRLAALRARLAHGYHIPGLRIPKD